MDELLDYHFAARTRRLRTGVQVGSLLIAAGLGLLWWIDPFWGGALVSLGALLFVPTLLQLRTVKRDRAAKALRERPGDVVWAYVLVDHGLEIGLRTGEIELLANAEEWILERLRPMLPNATFGYSDDRAREFKANPLSLMTPN
jgi:hypothetical protein